PALAGRRDAHPPPAPCTGAGAKGTDQDALPSSVLHLPLDLRRDPRSGDDLLGQRSGYRQIEVDMTTLAEASPDAASTTDPLPARPRLRAPGFDVLFTCVFALFGWGVGLERLSDNSFFWHLATGRLILDEGIPHS